MGSIQPELDQCGQSRLVLLVMAAVRVISLVWVLLLVFSASSTPVKRSAAPLSLADGNAEPINAMDGFYGNPLYRPYGFGSWGYGFHSTTVYGPNIYGGFYASG